MNILNKFDFSRYLFGSGGNYGKIPGAVFCCDSAGL